MDVLGVEVPELPEGHTALEVYVLIKGLDADGDVAHYTRTSAGLTGIEVVGMLATAQAVQTRAVEKWYLDDDDDPVEF